jgi:translation initiation factor 2 gamma subunit (eIF-2gamma)
MEKRVVQYDWCLGLKTQQELKRGITIKLGYADMPIYMPKL